MPTKSEMDGRRLNKIMSSSGSRAMARQHPAGLVEKLEIELAASVAERLAIEFKLRKYTRIKYHETQCDVRKKYDRYDDPNESHQQWCRVRANMMREHDILKTDLESNARARRSIKSRLAVVRGEDTATAKDRFRQNEEMKLSLLTEIRDLLHALVKTKA